MRSLGLLFLLSSITLACDPPAPVDVLDPALRCTPELVRGDRTQYVTSNLGMPTSAVPVRADFDGNNSAKNQLRQLVSGLGVVNIDVQPSIDAATAGGEDLVLLELTAPNRQNADCASLELARARPPHPGIPLPRFAGEDFFQRVQGSQVTLYGAIKDGVFHSVPSRLQDSQDKRFELALHVTPSAVLKLPLRGVSFEATFFDSVVGPALDGGQLQGVMPAQQAIDELAPALAAILTSVVNAAPTLEKASGLITILEPETSELSIKKCQVMADCCRLSYKTCKILREEVMASPVGGLLRPDVRVFDDAGGWSPTPNSREYNGYSTGLRVQGVSAAF